MRKLSKKIYNKESNTVRLVVYYYATTTARLPIAAAWLIAKQYEQNPHKCFRGQCNSGHSRVK